MSLSKYILLLAACAASLMLSGCGSTDTDFGGSGSRGNTAADSSLINTAPHIVHVDLVERVATLRNGSDVKEGFLIALDTEGKQTSVLKTLPMRSPRSLRTADVLEGKPQINNTVRAATSAEINELAKIYRDAQ